MSNTPFHLTGRTILITGASAGIGRQCAISIAKMGGNVIITGRNEKGLKETLNSVEGGAGSMYVADLTDEKQVMELSSHIPVIDGAVHCAGVVIPFPVKYINNEKIDETFNINFKAAVTLMTALFQKRKIGQNASIVFLSSFAGTFPYRGGALYAASKAALEKYSEVLATEHAANGIRANCISPAMVNTRVLEETFTGDRLAFREIIEKKHLLGFGEPEDVANLAVFLLSGASRWLTGQNIVLDGGYLLGMVSQISNTR